MRWFFYAKKFAHEVFDVGENGGWGKYMLKNFSCFQLTFCCSNMGGFWKHDAWHKTLFLLVITNSFVVPCTVCEILLVPALEIKGTGSAWPPIFGSKKDLFWRIWNSCWDLFLFHLEVVLLLVAFFEREMLRRSKIRHASKMSKANEKFSAKWTFLVEMNSLFLVSNRGGKGGCFRAPISFFLLIRKSFFCIPQHGQKRPGEKKKMNS